MSTTLPVSQPSRGLEKKTSPADGNSSDMNPPPSTAGSSQASQPPPPTHRRFVLTDHVALRLLEEDPAITVLVRRQKLEGYEIYLVEQWACSRDHPTFVITTYSGDPKDVAWGSILSLPTDESAWSPMVRAYFKALDRCYARRTETKYGTLMVTNLGAFPSALTVIPVPDGDAKKNRELFFVNVNLKRLGCSGRLGIKLAQPNTATQAKFHQLYRTSDKIPLNASVIELIRMCQIALVIFDKLSSVYADGLLCDHTEKAINDWWLEFGAEYYTVEPNDGILGPTTVSALLGMLIGARNRLSAHNSPVGKDVFDLECTKRGIAYFQKSQRIQKTGLLDRHTYDRLRRVTAKAASKEGWNMPRALKSTVAELGGKGGEMVMGMVGADKAGIADIETVDIDRFVELVHGERAKWLWLGKPRKTNTINMFNRLPDDLSSPEEQDHADTAKLLKKEATHEEHKLKKRETEAEKVDKLQETSGADNLDKEKDPYSKRAAIKRATEKFESSTHRFKDAVGLRSHHQHKTSKEDVANEQALQHTKSDVGKLTETVSGASARRTQTAEADFAKVSTESPRDSATTLLGTAVDGTSHDIPTTEPIPEIHVPDEDAQEDSRSDIADGSIAGSLLEDIEKIDSNTNLPFDPSDSIPIPLRRTQSSNPLTSYHASARNPNWWPRHLSFSIAEESVLTWTPLVSISNIEKESSDPALPLETKLATLQSLSSTYTHLSSRLTSLRTLDTAWTTETVSSILALDTQAASDTAELEQMYLARFEEYQALRDDAHEIVSRDRMLLQDAIRDLETLGAKLDYEIQGVRGKVDDVEDGVVELERQVEGVESRVRELEGVLGSIAAEEREGREGWGAWGLRMLTGIGKAPG